MELESTNHTVDVYHIQEIGGTNGTWVWDFGLFNLIGTEDYPVRKSSNLHSFGATVRGIDVNEMNNREPEKTVEVEIYEGDYVIYIETGYNDADVALSPSNEPHKIVSLNASKEGNDMVVLKKVGTDSRDTSVIGKSVYKKDWTPVKRF